MNMKWLWVGWLALWPMLAAAETWSGKVVSVEAGDRLTLKSGKKLIKIQLAGIEAPAAGQYGNKKSRKSLAELCLNRKATADIPSLPAKGLAVGTLGCNWSKKVYADAGFYQVVRVWLGCSPRKPIPVWCVPKPWLNPTAWVSGPVRCSSARPTRRHRSRGRRPVTPATGESTVHKCGPVRRPSFS